MGSTDLQGLADRPLDLPCPCRQAAPIGGSFHASEREYGAEAEIARVFAENFESMACARSGGN